MFVALVTQRAQHMRHYVIICGLSNSTIPRYLINEVIFFKKNYWTQNVCFDFL
jgi:hypothetical protein